MHSTKFKFYLEQAVKAPSGHNTQPWLFQNEEEGIRILPDFSRTLPIVDSNHRELFIALGCAVENICQAASYKQETAEVSILPDHSVRIKISATQSPMLSLFSMISKRQTVRRLYDATPIPQSVIDELQQIKTEPSTKFYFYPHSDDNFRLISNLIYQGNDAQMNNPAFISELKSWIRYNEKEAQNRRDGLSYAAFGAPNLPRFISKAAISFYLNAKRQNKTDSQNLQNTSYLTLFTTTSDSIDEWILLGRTLERFLLKTTELKLSYAFMNQPCEVQTLSCLLRDSLHLQEYPTLLLRLGYSSPMPYSYRRPFTTTD